MLSRIWCFDSLILSVSSIFLNISCIYFSFFLSSRSYYLPLLDSPFFVFLLFVFLYQLFIIFTSASSSILNSSTFLLLLCLFFLLLSSLFTVHYKFLRFIRCLDAFFIPFVNPPILPLPPPPQSPIPLRLPPPHPLTPPPCLPHQSISAACRRPRPTGSRHVGLLIFHEIGLGLTRQTYCGLSAPAAAASVAAVSIVTALTVAAALTYSYGISLYVFFFSRLAPVLATRLSFWNVIVFSYSYWSSLFLSCFF